jgi:hypothetical protein
MDPVLLAQTNWIGLVDGRVQDARPVVLAHLGGFGRRRNDVDAQLPGVEEGGGLIGRERDDVTQVGRRLHHLHPLALGQGGQPPLLHELARPRNLRPVLVEGPREARRVLFADAGLDLFHAASRPLLGDQGRPALLDLGQVAAAELQEAVGRVGQPAQPEQLREPGVTNCVGRRRPGQHVALQPGSKVGQRGLGRRGSAFNPGPGRPGGRGHGGVDEPGKLGRRFQRDSVEDLHRCCQPLAGSLQVAWNVLEARRDALHSLLQRSEVACDEQEDPGPDLVGRVGQDSQSRSSRAWKRLTWAK